MVRSQGGLCIHGGSTLLRLNRVALDLVGFLLDLVWPRIGQFYLVGVDHNLLVFIHYDDVRHYSNLGLLFIGIFNLLVCNSEFDLSCCCFCVIMTWFVVTSLSPNSFQSLTRAAGLLGCACGGYSFTLNLGFYDG